MATATAPAIETVEDYIRANPNADPKSLLDVLLQQNTRIREENRAVADVELDANGDFRPRNLAGLWRLGSMYAKSELVPDHYKGKPEDCAIAIQMALRCRVNIMTFLQASYVVKGRPTIDAKLGIAMLNASGCISGRIKYEISRDANGKPVKCIARATDAETGEIVDATVDWEMVTAEGWDKDKKNDKTGWVQKSKWNTLPELMFKYRSAMFLIRQSYPDVLFGMRTDDEEEDIETSKTAASESPRLTPTAAPQSLKDLTTVLATGNGNGDGGHAEKTSEEPTGDASRDAVEEAGSTSEIDRLAEYERDMQACLKLTETTQVYDEWFGPQAEQVFTPKENRRAVEIRDARRDAIRAASKKQGVTA